MRVLEDRFSDQAQTLALLQATLDAIPYSMCAVAEDGTIVLVNDAWRNFGSTNGQMDPNSGIGTNYLDVCRNSILGIDEPSDASRDVIRGFEDLLLGRASRFHVRYPCHSPQEKRWFQTAGSLVESGNDRWVILIHEDVTATTRAMETIAQDSGLLGNRDRKYVLLLCAGLATERVNLSLEHLDLVPHLEALFDAFRSVCPVDSRRFRRRVLGPLPGIVDPRALGQVIWELLHNAYKATDSSHTIDLQASRQGHTLIIEVNDNGPGFDVQAFEAVTHGLENWSADPGLGLTVAQLVMEHMNGSIQLESSASGTHIRLVLPTEPQPSV